MYDWIVTRIDLKCVGQMCGFVKIAKHDCAKKCTSFAQHTVWSIRLSNIVTNSVNSSDMQFAQPQFQWNLNPSIYCLEHNTTPSLPVNKQATYQCVIIIVLMTVEQYLFYFKEHNYTEASWS